MTITFSEDEIMAMIKEQAKLKLSSYGFPESLIDIGEIKIEWVRTVSTQLDEPFMWAHVSLNKVVKK